MDTLENIKELASYTIFNRGKEYYEDGAVTKLAETEPDKWEATVDGTEDYSVDIWLEGNEIIDWYCDCPYDGGDVCKHVIATLLAIRAKKEQNDKKTKSIEPVDAEVIDTKNFSDKDWTQVVVSLQKKELSDFILEYGQGNSAFKEAILRKFVNNKKTKPTKDYRAEVKNCFESYYQSRGYHYRRNNFGERNWEEVFNRLNTILDEAVLLIKYGDLDAVIAIALQTLQSIGEEYDEELVYNEDLYVDNYCEKAGDFLLEIARHSQSTQKQKSEVLQGLRQLMKLTPYSDYDVYDLDELMRQVNILIQSPEESLLLIDELIKERKDSYDLYKLVLQKVELLQQMDDSKKAEETIRKFLYLPQIRRMEVDKLISKDQLDQAITLLDEGIELDTKGEHSSYQTVEWMKQKLQIYEKQHATSNIMSMCRQLFILTGGSFEYYQTLKKIVPDEKWTLYLSSMLKDTPFRHSFSWGNSVLSDIYVAEKDYENLFKLISVATGREQLNGLMKYAHHLKDDYSNVLIALYNVNLLDYAEENLGRNHYEFIAEGLSCMQKLNGGTVAVKHLLREFREKYKRRSAMMQILSKF